MVELHECTATDLVSKLRNRDVSRTELTQHYLDRIERANPVLRAFVTVDGDRALERATSMDREAARSSDAGDDAGIDTTVLAGLPIGDKDLVNRAGVPTSYGSRAMAGFVPDVSEGLVVALDDNGANSLGKTNAPEFGFPSYTENLLAGGVARNPWTDRRTGNSDPREQFCYGPGGSSGGAAVAVAAGMLPVAPGSDGGGSVRIPAAACGLVGLKPSRGRVPDGSGYEFAGGLVVAGPLARTVADAALLLDAMIARDGNGNVAYRYASRPASRTETPASYLGVLQANGAPPRRLRIAVNTWTPWAEAYECACDPEALAVLERAVSAATALGHHVEAFTPTAFPGYVDAFRAVWRGSAASLPLTEDHLEHVEPLTAWLVRSGRELPVAEHARGLNHLAAFERHIIAEYAPFDLVLTPTLAMTPRELGWYDQTDGEHNFVQQCQYTPYTSYVNAAGLPAITMPVGGGALPMGVQGIGRPGDELTLLQFANELEQHFDWVQRTAPGWHLGDAS
ncbi:amidase [Gulosibacter bifidus]|uniref:Amidase n=1 Tax=Gulosibacter bifidus TaxID=272239 RepID=A0ABW5RG93_9MICO|nr:amidase [Gulosibacter bifidus]